jgi:hypothetical protein
MWYWATESGDFCECAVEGFIRHGGAGRQTDKHGFGGIQRQGGTGRRSVCRVVFYSLLSRFGNPGYAAGMG